MHPLRVLLFLSVGIAGAVAIAFGWAVHRIGAPLLASIIFALIVFGAFMLPWSAVFLWAIRRASDLDVLIDRARHVVEGGTAKTILDRPYHGELSELARAIDEIRALIEQEKAWSVEQRATLVRISDSLGEGLLALSPKGKIVLANERVNQMFGTRKDLIGRPFLEVVRKQSLVSAFDAALQGDSSTERVTIHSPAGDEKQIEIRVFPVTTSAEVAAVALFIDVTQLERLQNIRKDFLEDFSHEVRTPLTGLRSAAETFAGGALTPAQEEELRGVILRQLRRIERLVQDLSELNRIESGELVLDRQPLNLLELAEEVAADFRGRSITVSGQPVTAFADASRMQQAISNLVDNACKHGGGEVAIEVRSDGNEAVVSVSDRGEGIPSTELERVFNRFYRVDRSRSQHVPGVGLGLAIAKHLVRLHDGTIRAFNRPEGGATFEIRFAAGQRDR